MTTKTKSKPNLRKSKADAKPAPKEKKEPVPYATEIPPFLYEDGEEYEAPVAEPKEDGESVGTVLMVNDPEKPKAAPRPIRYVRRDFPKSREGETNWWDYKIALCEHKKAMSLLKADPLKKKKAKLDRMMEAIKALKAEIGGEESGDEE
jgi:hypothetical protein